MTSGWWEVESCWNGAYTTQLHVGQLQDDLPGNESIYPIFQSPSHTHPAPLSHGTTHLFSRSWMSNRMSRRCPWLPMALPFTVSNAFCAAPVVSNCTIPHPLD